MATIQTILAKYRPKVDNLDLELILAHELKKSREFVLTYPEYEISENLIRQLAEKIARRRRGEPLAHILGHKEFYGLDFKVTKDTLIPRPETELLVEQALQKIPAYAKAPAGRQETLLRQGFGGQTRNLPTLPTGRQAGQAGKKQRINIIDVGTGSGNIIISIAKNSNQRAVNNKNIKYFATDISKNALQIAKHNAKKHNLTKIKFIKSSLLDHFLKNNKTIKQFSNLIILANLPYLSKEIYSATLPTVKNFEPKYALYSPKEGLAHYEKLLKQIRNLKNSCFMLHASPRRSSSRSEGGLHVSCFMEISPEQKKALTALIKKILPSAKIEFKKDLAGKWRVCVISLN